MPLLGHVFYLLGTIWNWRAKRYLSATEHFLDAFMYTAWRMNCANPRDHLYALGAMDYVRSKPTLQPSYALAVPQLWKRVALSFLTSPSEGVINSAMLLAFPETEERRRLSWRPSWVPNFHAMSEMTLRKYGFYTNESEFHCAGGKSAAFLPSYCSSEPNVLRVRGIFLSRIASIQHHSQPPPTGDLWYQRYSSDLIGAGTEAATHELIRWYLLCREFAALHCLERPDYPALIDSFATFLVHGRSFKEPATDRNMMYGRLATEGVEPLDERWDGALGRWLEQSCSNDDERARCGEVLCSLRRHLTPFLQKHRFHYYLDTTRLLAATEDGRTGWVPRSTRKGDWVCLLEGAPLPFVLREGGNGCHRVVGDAYVHGISQGEAWLTDDEQPVVIRLE
ncbi:hypothetical protein LTR36_003251 [Oleoguttula mirabilis]|uniref:Uncharacterized protein n=1 Tax=Oleoguttula mirabilis TaxID=1507867 RepID=A0AAV9JXG8_9PEZI|nr:hypothetical protein LTR36_003251 [Oleoguttula mirabilis]